MIAILIVIFIVAGGGFYIYKQLVDSLHTEVQGPVYATSEVTRGDIHVGVETTGRLDPSSGGAIRVSDALREARVNELIIDEVMFSEGDEVGRQETVVRLLAPGLDDDVVELQNQIRRERESLANLTGVSEAELMSIDPARGVTISAPIDGRVQELDLDEGEEVSQGQTIARVVDASTYTLILNLYQAEYEMVEEDQSVVLRFPYFGGLQDGVITNISSNPVPYKRNEDDEFALGFAYEVEVEGENPGLVQKGMRVEVGVEQENGGTYYFGNATTVDGFLDEQRVFSSTEGIVAEVHASNMAEVKEGDPIITLAGSDVEDTIRNRLDKIRELESDLRQLNSAVDRLNVTSPMEGILARINNEEGDSVNPGDYIGNVYQTSQMSMMTTVDDIDVLHISQEAPVRVMVDALPDEVFEGEVRDISTQWSGDGEATNFRVFIEVKGGAELRPGMQARAHIDAGSAEDVLLVPIEAVFQEESRYRVEVLDEENIPSVVTVEIGLMNDRYAEIESGLEEGDIVITGSSSDLLPTQDVEQGGTLMPETTPDEDGDE